MSSYQLVKLQDVCQIESGGTPSSNNPSFWDGDINWATLVDVKNKYTNSTKRKITQAGLKNSSAKILPVETVLFSSRATIGEVSITNVELATNQGFKNFICDRNKILPEYLYYILKKEAKNIADSAPSTTFKEISKSKLGEYIIPLPSINNQKQIIRKLNQADLIRHKRKQSLNLLDQYLKSIFLEMFGDPINNPKKWNNTILESLTKKITDGTHKTPRYTSTGVKFISAKNIKRESIDWTDIKYISEEEHRLLYKRCNPEKGDLLLTKSGSLGMIAIVDVDFEFSLFESLALLKVDKELIDPIYLREYLNLEQIKNLYLKITKGVGVKHLHLIDIKTLPVIVPPISEQKKFVSVVAKNKLIRANMITQSEFLESQFQSLMQSSFHE